MPFDRLHAYFRSKGFEPFAFQLLAWERTANRVHQLIQCPTGSGKTLAATGAMIEKTPGEPSGRGSPTFVRHAAPGDDERSRTGAERSIGRQ